MLITVEQVDFLADKTSDGDFAQHTWLEMEWVQRDQFPHMS